MKYVLKYLLFAVLLLMFVSFAYASFVNGHVVELAVGVFVSGIVGVLTLWSIHKDVKALIAAFQRWRSVSEGS